MTRAAPAARHAFLAVLAYLPLLLTAPGRVAADTKTYLYLDPGRLLARAPWMWDPNIGLGTVTHQNIGYLFPMGPFFWVMEALGLPDWAAQRLWVATIMFAAGAGVLFLLRSIGTSGGVLAAATVYMLSPYVLHYAARISVLLLPWAALPWLIALTHRAVLRGGWRHPALFAVVVTLVGGVNATALFLVGLGPLLWLPFAVWVQREASLAETLRAVMRIGVLTALCSLWWMAGLALQGGYGLDVLRYTETLETVTRTALSNEVLRGLGYWFFYGGDKLGPWIEPGGQYTQHLWLIAAGYAVPLLAFASAFAVRWRYRAYFAALVVMGTAVAVGAHPYEAPSPLGGAFKAFATSSSAGLALRSTPRAVPLVALGTAVLIGAGLSALSSRVPRAAMAGTALVVALAVVGLPPLWNGGFIGENLQRDEEVPAYWRAAAAHLDEQGDETRVLAVPGTDFAAYRWGNTVDPILPGLIDRPFVARELIPYGTPPSADLLVALDRRLQEGLLEADALGPVARLLGVGDVVLRADLEYERYRTPRPRALWDLLQPPPDGLGPPVGFGEPVRNETSPSLPLRDEIFLADEWGRPDPPPVAVFPVERPLPIVRTHEAGRSLVVAGDADGLVDAAAVDLLDDPGAVLLSAALAAEPEAVRRAVDRGGALLLTDTNRRRGERWVTVRDNAGYTEQAGEEPLVDDPSDNRLPVFPDAGDDAFTVVEQRGVRRVQASRYGNPVSFTPEDRAANALDGDLDTAWRVGAFAPVGGERLLVELDEPITTDRFTVVQPLTGPRNRFITELGVHLDGEEVAVVPLDESSRTPEGQEIVLEGARTFRTLELVVEGDNVGRLARYDVGISGVGLAELRLDDVRVDEVVRLPRDLLALAGPEAAAERPLTVLLTRLRVAASPVRSDEERTLTRSFDLPAPRSFALRGEARVTSALPDEQVDAVLGAPLADAGGVTARSSDRLTGALGARARAAFDGDRTTAWTPGFGPQDGRWVEITTAAPVTVDRLDLEVLADGLHSVPTRVRVEGDGVPVATVELPPVADGGQEGHAVTVPVTVPAFTARTVRVVVEAVRAVETIEWFGGQPHVMPVGIVEAGLPGVVAPPLPAVVPDRCRDDLLTVDGRPLPVRVTGSTDAAVDLAALEISTCDGSRVALSAGDHELRSAAGPSSGFDVDRLVLTSPSGDGDAAAAGGGTGRAPRVEVVDDGRTTLDVEVSEADGPFWLVLGQSHSPGWSASVDGRDLGEPTLLDGFANGWYVEPGGDGELSLSLRWGPQRLVWGGLAVSAAALLACLAIAVLASRRRRDDVPAGGRPEGAAGPERPRLHSPLVLGGAAPGWPVAVVTAVVCAAGAALLVRPVLGVVVGVATLVALRVRWGRIALSAGSLGALGLAAAYVVVKQWRNGYPPDFGWPAFFEWAHWAAWVAVVLLAADVVADHVRQRRHGA